MKLFITLAVLAFISTSQCGPTTTKKTPIPAPAPAPFTKDQMTQAGVAAGVMLNGVNGNSDAIKKFITDKVKVEPYIFTKDQIDAFCAGCCQSVQPNKISCDDLKKTINDALAGTSKLSSS